MLFDDTTNHSFPAMSEPFQIISTQRDKRKLLLDGYTYRLDRSNDRGIEQWKCSKKRCRGRIHLHSSFLYSNITFISSHSYSAESAQCQAAIVINHIRTTAQYNHHESAKDIVDRLLKSVNDDTAALNSKDFYMKLFNELFPLQTPRYILTNFDEVLIESLNNHSELPTIKICSIFLHNELCQSIQQYKHDKSIKCLLALAYISHSDVIPAFEALQGICSVSMEGCTGIYDKFEDLCIGRLRPNGRRSQPVFPIRLCNWVDDVSYFDNLILINTSIQQWDHMFRASLSDSSHRSFYEIIRTIQQLYKQKNRNE